MSSTVAAGGVLLLAVLAPFELTRPLLRLPGQSLSNVEAALLVACVVWVATVAWSAQWRLRRIPLATVWAAFVLAMAVAALSAVEPTRKRDTYDWTACRRGSGVSACRPRLDNIGAVAGSDRRVRRFRRRRGVLAILEYLQSTRCSTCCGVSAIGHDGRLAGARRRTSAVSDDRLDVSGGRVRVWPRPAVVRARPRAAESGVGLVPRARDDRRGDHADLHARRIHHDGDEPGVGRRVAMAAAWSSAASSCSAPWRCRLSAVPDFAIDAVDVAALDERRAGVVVPSEGRGPGAASTGANAVQHVPLR